MDKYLEIKQLFESQAQSEKALQMAKYMRNQFVFYGLPTPQRKQIYKDLLKQEKKNKQIDWEFLNLCYQDEHREFQYLVGDYLQTMKAFLKYEDIAYIQKYVQTKQWWDSVDFLDRIIGDIGLYDQRVNDLMLEWSKSEDIWMRRIAIDHQLCRKDKTNTQLLEKILVNNLGSEEFFVNKAIGWALRDYSKTNPQWVQSFIERHQDQMSSLSIKEGSKYI